MYLLRMQSALTDQPLYQRAALCTQDALHRPQTQGEREIILRQMAG